MIYEGQKSLETWYLMDAGTKSSWYLITDSCRHKIVLELDNWLMQI